MIKTIASLATAVLIAGFAWNAQATPLTFNIDLNASSVDIFYNGRYNASLTATEVLVDGDFTVDDTGTPYAIDFFTMSITSKRFGWVDYGIRATLVFEQPTIGPVVGEGGGFAFTIGGIVSGGVLTWNSGVPATYIVEGNEVVINFEEGIRAGYGSLTTVHALITNNGGATPVPEPGTLMLLGVGIIGLAVANRKRSKTV